MLSKIPELKVLIILYGSRWQQEEELGCVWTQEGQEDSTHQEQEIHLQHTHSKTLSLMWCVDRP